jgi:hypothetical protein
MQTVSREDKPGNLASLWESRTKHSERREPAETIDPFRDDMPSAGSDEGRAFRVVNTRSMICPLSSVLRIVRP